MAAASVISIMKVDWALARSSAAPMRVWIASIGPSRQREAGTKEPIAASSTVSATWRMKVLLPPMFGPVMTSRRRAASSRQSLGMKLPAPDSASRASTTGWRPRSISMQGCGTKSGRHQSSVRARSASAASTSSEASARPSSDSAARCGCSASSSCSHSHFSRASARSCAESALSSKALSSGVMKRSAFFSVWRRW